MNVVVKIINTEQYLIVKSSWIEKFEEYVTNYGICMNKQKLFTLFYSINENTEANFNVEIKDNYCGDGDYRYKGNLLVSFEKKSDAVAYLIKKTSKTPQEEATNTENQIQVKTERVEMLQVNLGKLNKRIGNGERCEAIDLTKDDIEAYENLYNSDNEDGDEEVPDYNKMEVRFSGDHLFYIDDDGNRHYQYQEIILTRIGLSKLKEYNRIYNDILGDYNFYKVLLKDVFGSKVLEQSFVGENSHLLNIGLNALDEVKLKFIRDLMSIRSKNDRYRIARLEETANNICVYLRQQNAKKARQSTLENI